MDKRITCLLGAGATLELGSPSTKKITIEVGSLIRNRFFKDLPSLYDALRGMVQHKMGYKIGDEAKPNFEEMFHALELIRDFEIAKNRKKNNTSITHTVLQLNSELETWDYSVSNRALNLIVEAIGKLINGFDQEFLKHKSDDQWFRDFWTKLLESAKLDIATLNYDTALESIVKPSTDGFSERVEDAGAYRFHPEDLNQINVSRIMHLHGCINYGMAPIDYSHKYDYEDSFHDMFKYDTYKEAIKHWDGHSQPDMQTGEEIFIGPIITGLRKTEKLLVNPYEFYHDEFQRAILHNNALLIIGYGAGNLYLNDILMRMAELHGKKRHIVWIGKIPKDKKEEWIRDKEAEEPSSNEIELVSYLMQNSYFERLLRLDKFPECGYFTSKDGCMRVYFNGFKEAVKDASLINFLNKK